ncbi:hypothetical protein HN858_01715 [Candidatus Falkowbacteria bacterium]|nr:hypothetical protein [Candidatus Falkowbacteria bacterium]MBT7500675.1 hypothetical protein [Candidatus Falkowbacteria bacterium]
MFFSNKSNSSKSKFILGLLTFFFVLQIALPGLLFPLTANAQYTDPAALPQRIGLQIKTFVKNAADKIKKFAKEKLFKGLILTVSVTLKNTLVKLAKKAAEASVSYITTGSWGEGSMFYEDVWGDFKKDLKDQMVGQFLDNVNEMFGIDICQPKLPELELKMKLGLQLNYLETPGYDQLKKPDCTLSALTDNWQAFGDQIKSKYEDALSKVKDPYGTSVAFLQESFDVSFSPSKSEIGGYMTMEGGLIEAQQKEVDAKEKQRLEDQGSKGVTGVTGKNIKTPSSLTRSHSQAELEKAKQTTKSEMSTSKDVITEIPGQVALAFLNTFVSSLWESGVIQKYFQKGLVDKATSFNPEQQVFEVKKQLQKEFASQKINFAMATKQIDLMTDYANCPTGDGGSLRGVNNCVMDSGFAEAVRNATQGDPISVSEAIEQGYIVGNRPFIGPNDRRNSDADCFERGFCYSNLVKLRKARIIPIGWEIAASKVQEGQLITLQYVMDNFYNCNTGDPEVDKFCHLVDPNWILKYPQTQCKAAVSGPMLLASGASERSEACVDMPSCIEHNEDGSCRGWGYCAAEKGTFKFGGQGCSGAYDSCQVMTNSRGKEVSFLMNTVEQKNCDESNVGCLWYSTMRDATDEYNWDALFENRVHLNRKIYDNECPPGAEGCTRLISTSPGLGTNLLPNGSFEIFEGDVIPNAPMEIPGWAGTHILNGDDKYDATYSLDTQGPADLISEWVPVVRSQRERYFAVSAQTYRDSSGIISVSIETDKPTLYTVEVLKEQKNELDNYSGLWTEVYVLVSIKPSSNLGQQLYSSYENIKVTLNTDVSAYYDAVILEELDVPSENSRHVYNDYASKNVKYSKKAPEYLSCYNVGKKQCSDGAGSFSLNKCEVDSDCTGVNNICAVNYNDDNYGHPLTTASIYKGDDFPGTDTIKGCDKFAGLCSAEEVGCNAYTPSVGGNVVYGTSAYSDYCPQECNGYQSYSQSETFFADYVFPLYFIADTAKECQSAQVGCEEFTNLDLLDEGGEAKEYFTEMRLCKKLPDDQHLCGNYYTWEGDEVTGYQLQAYTLQKDDGDDPTGAPKLVLESYLDECNQDIFEEKINPDCRQFFDESGTAYFRILSKTISCSEDCHPYRRTIAFDDSTECTNRQGRWANGECIFMTISGEGKSCSVQNAGCKEYKGNLAGIEVEVENYSFSSDTIDEELGSLKTSYSVPLITPEFGSFLQVTQGNGIETSGDPALYTNSDLVGLGGGDYELSFWIKGNSPDGKFTVNVKEGDALTADPVEQLMEGNLTENFTFYHMVVSSNVATAGRSIGIEINADTFLTDMFNIDNFKLSQVNDVKYLIESTWATPTTCDYKLNSDTGNSDNYLAQAHLGCREYRDPEANTHYLKSYSSLCESGSVGCQAVLDTKNNVYPYEKEYRKNFSNEEVCELVVQNWGNFKMDSQLKNTLSNKTLLGVDATATQCALTVEPFVIGTQYSFKKSCEASGYDWDLVTQQCYEPMITILQDSLMYLVLNDQSACVTSEKGCTALGLPNLTAAAKDILEDPNDANSPIKYHKGEKYVNTEYAEDDYDGGWNNVFYKLDPEMFENEAVSPLCSNLESSCEEFVDGKGSTHYFKNPGDKTCQYTKASKDSESVYGWYTQDAEGNYVECDSKEYYNDGVLQMAKTLDADYTGWVGLCPGTEDQCTAFVDPTDKTKALAGRPYYYINNDLMDNATCNSVSRKDGCILFNDTSQMDADGEPSVSYNSFETYINSKNPSDPSSNPYSPVTAVSTDSALIDHDAIFIDSDYTAENCGVYKYCKWLTECLAQENDYEYCREFVSFENGPVDANGLVLGDANPSIEGKQLYCPLTEDEEDDGNTWKQNKGVVCTANEVLKTDANKIIKVNRDRECGAWYACRSGHWNWDSAKGEYVKVCDRIGLCEALTDDVDSAACAKFVQSNDETNILSFNEIIENKYINKDRGVGWYDNDYSGFAIPANNPVQFTNAFDINQNNPDEDPDYHLVNQSMNSCQNDTDCEVLDFCKTPTEPVVQAPVVNPCIPSLPTCQRPELVGNGQCDTGDWPGWSAAETIPVEDTLACLVDDDCLSLGSNSYCHIDDNICIADDSVSCDLDSDCDYLGSDYHCDGYGQNTTCKKLEMTSVSCGDEGDDADEFCMDADYDQCWTFPSLAADHVCVNVLEEAKVEVPTVVNWGAYDLGANTADCHFDGGECCLETDVTSVTGATEETCLNVCLDGYEAYAPNDNYCSAQSACLEYLLGVIEDELADEEEEDCRCLNNTCVKPFNDSATFELSPSPECRAYPDIEAPFTLSEFNRSDQKYENATKFENVGDMDSDKKDDYACNYYAVTFGGKAMTLYVPKEYKNELSSQYCQDTNTPCDCSGDSSGGTPVKINNEKMCSSDKCSGDMCLKVDGANTEYTGWQGYCLEWDDSTTMNNDPDQHPCLTWYPTQSLAGLQDLSNNYLEAGYNPNENVGRLFTTNAKGRNQKMFLPEDPADDIHNIKEYIRPLFSINNSSNEQKEQKNGTLPNWSFSLKAGSDGDESYKEGVSSISGPAVYDEELVGIMIDCVDGQSTDWCESAKDWDGQVVIDPGNKTEEFDIERYAYFLKNGTDNYGNYEKGYAGATDKHTFKKDDWAFFCPKGEGEWIDTNTQGASEKLIDCFGNDYSKWYYWQVVWHGGHELQENHNNYKFGGPKESVYLKGDNAKKESKFTPMFMGKGYDYSQGECIDIINQTTLDPDYCDNPEVADVEPEIDDTVYELELYKTDDSEWVKKPLAGCSEDSDCDGTWEWQDSNSSFVYMPEGVGKCKTINAELSVCINTECRMNKSNNSGNPDCRDDLVCIDNDNGNYGLCASDISAGLEEPAETELGFDFGDIVAVKQEENGFKALTGYCDVGNHDGDASAYKNYFGLRIIFDETGRMRKSWFALCDDSKDGGWQELVIKGVFHEYAQEMVQVYDSSNVLAGESLNKAFTNRIYQYQKWYEEDDPNASLPGGGNGIVWGSEPTPFGSAVGDSLEGRDTLMKIPDKYMGSNNSMCVGDTCDGSYDEMPGGSLWTRFDDNYTQGTDYGGKPYGCTQSLPYNYLNESHNAVGRTIQCTNIDEVTIANNKPEYSSLDYIFAKVYKGWTWNYTTKKYEEKAIYTEDFSGDTITDYTPHPPMIASVGPGEAGGALKASPNQLTIATSLGSYTGGDIVAHNGQLDLTMKFYAWAAHEQMPLKQVTINWGDGAGSITNSGSFKNHKPFCQEKVVIPMGQCGDWDGFSCPCERVGEGDEATYECNDNSVCGQYGDCDDPKDRFGDTSDACHEGYFSYENTYICYSTDGLPDCVGDNDTSCKEKLSTGETACRFLPGVQVKDNWGWCNKDNEYTGYWELDCDFEADRFEFYDGYIYIIP